MAQNEGRIALALQAYQRGQFRSIRAAANSYDVDRSTLQRRARGVPPQRDTRPTNTKLTQLEENCLEEWILLMDQRGLAPRADTVRQMANLLLSKRAPELKVGINWVRNYVLRHDSLKSRFNRKYDYQRALCEDPRLLRDWFQLVHNTQAKYGIAQEDIYNFDETVFQMGVISTAKVISGSQRARPVSIQPGNREWVTAIECVRATGESIPPMIIFKGKMHLSTWYAAELGIPSNWTIGVSDNGWTTDTLGLTWLTEVFEKHTKDRTIGKYRLLILDGHGSHGTPEFDLFCREHSIVTLCMPPHSSHLIQPLDVSCFGPLKKAYSKQVELQMQGGINHINKPDFLTNYSKSRLQALSSSNILGGFAATGLVPFNPECVLEKLHITLRTPTPPALPIQSSPWNPKTPHTIRDLERQTQSIRHSIRHSESSPTQLALNQVIKGCQLAIHNATLLAEENRQLRAENTRKKLKRARRKTQIATGGVLTTKEGLDRSQIDNIESVEPVGQVRGQLQEARVCAPLTCSLCKSLAHTARTCPLRVNSN
jgi:hypothetical protein